MLWEASMTMIMLMVLLWGAAIWASYQEGSDGEVHSGYSRGRKAA